MATPHWTPQKSTTLSIVCTWIALAGAVAVAAVLPVGAGERRPTIFTELQLAVDPGAPWRPLLATYLCLAAGAAALVILLQVLHAIRRGDVFVAANVARLRRISYCGFAIAVVSIANALVVGSLGAWTVWGGIAIVAAFLALIMRVVKNVIAAAVVLQEDSDYTI